MSRPLSCCSISHKLTPSSIQSLTYVPHATRKLAPEPSVSILSPPSPFTSRGLVVAPFAAIDVVHTNTIPGCPPTYWPGLLYARSRVTEHTHPGSDHVGRTTSPVVPYLVCSPCLVKRLPAVAS